MKLRYYLRGLGIGLLICGAVSLAADDNSRGMTDAQVRERAIELGMTLNPVLTDIASAESTQESSATETESEKTTEDKSTEDAAAESEEVTTVSAQEGTEESSEAAAVTIVIDSGDG